MTDGISGVSSSGGERIGESEIEEPSELAELLRGINDEDRIESILEEEVGLRGIRILLEGSDIQREELQRRLQETQDTEVDRLIEEELEQLAEIQDQSELLKEIIARLSIQNDRTDEVLAAIESFNQDYLSHERLVFKDSGVRELDQAESAIDLVEEDDIVTDKVLIKSDSQNDGKLYIGSDNVSIDNGFEIERGAEEEIPVDLSRQITKIVGESAGDTYTYLALGAD